MTENRPGRAVRAAKSAWSAPGLARLRFGAMIGQRKRREQSIVKGDLPLYLGAAGEGCAMSTAWKALKPALEEMASICGALTASVRIPRRGRGAQPEPMARLRRLDVTLRPLATTMHDFAPKEAAAEPEKPLSPVRQLQALMEAKYRRGRAH